MSHPFGDLLTFYRARKHGLSQAKLADMMGYDPAVVARMAQGQRDLTGPMGRERVLRLITALADADAMQALDEANALLAAADMPPLYEALANEAVLLRRLNTSTAEQARVSAPQHNLPVPLTSFVGRDREINGAIDLLRTHRLLTLTGPGGVGKTRLALEIAIRVAGSFAEGVWLVSLGALTASDRVAETVATTVAAALGLSLTPPRSALDMVIDHLATRRMLLILDNCEHLVDAAAHTIERLLRACPGLSLLATSREVLMVPSEITWRVPPLRTPDPARLPADLLEFDSARLFVERATAQQPDFELTADNATAVAHICDRLDGIPLALELAAALMQTFTVQEVAQRLDQRFVRSTPVYRTATPRHQTLHNTVQWSYDLLTADEQQLLARLSVFSGGWTAEAAEAVCGQAGGESTLPVLRQLVQKSLVAVEQEAGRTRYRLLRTIRDFVAERLAERGEIESTRARHLHYLVQLAAEADELLLGSRHVEGMARLDADLGNIRAALSYSKGKLEWADARLRLVASLTHFWSMEGYSHEGLSWLHDAMGATGPIERSTWANAYFALLWLLMPFDLSNLPDSPTMETTSPLPWSGLSNAARPVSEWMRPMQDLLAESERVGDLRSAALLHLALSLRQGWGEAAAQRKQHVEAALALSQAAGYLRGEALARTSLMYLTFTAGDNTTALEMFEANLEFLQQHSLPFSLCEVLSLHAWMMRERSDSRRPQQSLERVVQLAEQHGFMEILHSGYYALECHGYPSALPLATAFLERQRANFRANQHATNRRPDAPILLAVALHQLGRMYLNRQQFDEAIPFLEEALTLWQQLNIGERVGIGRAWTLIDRAQVARFQGDAMLAEQCFTESMALFAVSSFSIKGVWPQIYRGHLHAVQHNGAGALADFRAALQILRPYQEDWSKLIYAALAGVGAVFHQHGHCTAAATVLGGVAAGVQRFNLMSFVPFNERVDLERILATVVAGGLDKACAANWQAGAQMSLEELMSLAI